MSEDKINPSVGIPRRALSKIDSMLVAGEKIQADAIQRRIFALTHRRSLVAATTGRLIGMRRNLIAGFSPVDLRWQDIKNVHITAGIFGSTLTVTALTQPDLATDGGVRVFRFSGLRKNEAQAVYRIGQSQEQAWREKRRQRELEELRAKSGGFQGSMGDASPPSSEETTERLRKAKDLLEQGLISDSEYETIKARVVNQF
jgi:hypothetical protein